MKGHSKFAAPLCLAIAATILVGCAQHEARGNFGDCNLQIGGTLLKLAAEKRFAYRDLVYAACHNRREALLNVLLFTQQTDGEAMLDHANVLRMLRDHLGTRRFEAAVRSLGTERKEQIDALIRTAEKLHEKTLEL